MAPEAIEPTDLTQIALSLATTLHHQGLIEDTSSTTVALVERALIATTRHLGGEVYDHAYLMPDGERRRAAHEPGFYGYEGATEQSKRFRTLTLTVEDGEWEPRSQ